MSILNELPTVIHGPGDYVTRLGHRVTIHAVNPATAPGCTEFLAKGSVWRMFRGKYRPRGYTIWHISGRGFPLREDGRDVLGPWTG